MKRFIFLLALGLVAIDISAAGAPPNPHVTLFDMGLSTVKLISETVSKGFLATFLTAESKISFQNPLVPGGKRIPLFTSRDAVEIIRQAIPDIVATHNGKYIAKNIGVSYATEKIVQILSGIPWYFKMRPQDLIENPWAATFVSLAAEETARQNVRSALKRAIDGQRPDEFTFLALRWAA